MHLCLWCNKYVDEKEMSGINKYSLLYCAKCVSEAIRDTHKIKLDPNMNTISFK